MTSIRTGGNYNTTVVSVTTSATVVLPTNTDRKNLVLFNQGSTAVRIWLDSNTTHYTEIPAKTGLELAITPFNAINAITLTGTCVLSVWET